MGERLFLVFASERLKKNEVPSQIRGKLRIQRGCAEKSPKDLHDSFGVKPDTDNHRSLHETGGSSTMSYSLGRGNLGPPDNALDIAV